MAASQRTQDLKFELLVPIDTAPSVAVMSCNYHVDHFGEEFAIRTPDGAIAHTACIGFGMERLALALLSAHGPDPAAWPADVVRALRPATDEAGAARS